MGRASDISNSVTISTRSSEQKRRAYALLNSDDENVRNASNLLKLTHDAINIIATSLASGNSDFFAEYENYTLISRIFGRFNIEVKDSIADFERFKKAPTREWVKLTMLLFSILLGFESNGGVKAVVANGEYDKQVHGVILELTVSAGYVNDSKHKISVVIGDDNAPPYIALDSTPMLI